MKTKEIYQRALEDSIMEDRYKKPFQKAFKDFKENHKGNHKRFGISIKDFEYDEKDIELGVFIIDPRVHGGDPFYKTDKYKSGALMGFTPAYCLGSRVNDNHYVEVNDFINMVKAAKTIDDIEPIIIWAAHDGYPEETIKINPSTEIRAVFKMGYMECMGIGETINIEDFVQK